MWIYCCVYRPKDFPNMPDKLSSPWCVDVLAAIGCRVNIRIWRLMSVGMGISYKISTVKDKKCWEIDPFGVFILHNGIWNEWFQISEYCHVANLIISILLVWIKQIEQNRRNNIFFFSLPTKKLVNNSRCTWEKLWGACNIYFWWLCTIL